jgi:hypothetical protein
MELSLARSHRAVTRERAVAAKMINVGCCRVTPCCRVSSRQHFLQRASQLLYLNLAEIYQGENIYHNLHSIISRALHCGCKNIKIGTLLARNVNLFICVALPQCMLLKGRYKQHICHGFHPHFDAELWRGVQNKSLCTLVYVSMTILVVATASRKMCLTCVPFSHHLGLGSTCPPIPPCSVTGSPPRQHQPRSVAVATPPHWTYQGSGGCSLRIPGR